ncbi:MULTISPECIES: homocysteine S-methyltransferase family protein [Marinobacter]|uniref:homocysteine S-methyltransferase family protein n=2 Tax=Marinobacteraceae TaxID=2887365 RepID=UPI00200030C0|nr:MULTISPECIES: homocysteine S-methyltransferase family protein [Marinobacter]MCK2149064.1 homocysteine S-methyltransferase family protein [Marinobacter alexandrii]
MKELLKNHQLVLAEAAVVERLRRDEEVELDPELVHAPLINCDAGKKALRSIYREYLDIAEAHDRPILLCTPTWRANKERVLASVQHQNINAEAVKFLGRLVEDEARQVPVKIGGLIGCKNDCYLPEEALSLSEAKEFHEWQINQLASEGVDFLIAVTLPSVEEAAGIAVAMEATGLPYIISFVIGSDGKVLDGTEIQTAFEYVDTKTVNSPLGYFVNCSFPSFLKTESLSENAIDRLIGIQANASSLSHAELDGSEELKSESVSEWGSLMLQLSSSFGVKILGGCCGTDGRHLEYLTENISA